MEISSLSLPPLTERGEVVTFYSYKGGTGRTMALSNLAVLLARQDNATTPVLMIDWDMEAPGLHHYFDHTEEREGVLELFEACRDHLSSRRKNEPLDGDELAQKVLDAVGWQQYVSRVDQGSQLYLMRAGRFDDTYAERMAEMRWDALFDRCPALFRCFADNLARHFRHVLVDSRTGRTDTAGICTTLLPQKLVVVFTPNRQSLEGVQALVARATAYRRSDEDEQRPLVVYPLPSRIEMSDSTQRAQWRRGDSQQNIVGYQPIFERVIRECYGLQHLSLDSYFDEVQLQQTRTFAYGEQLAVRMDQGGDRFSLTRTFEAFLAWLSPGYFPWQSGREIHLLRGIDEARRALDNGGAQALAQPLARDLNLLGELYCREGKLRQALTSFEESLGLRLRGLGDDHADTLISKSNLAGALRQQGLLDQARCLEQDIVDTRQRTLGADHLDTLAARANLADTLARQELTSEALAMQDMVLGAYLRVLGAEHPLTLACKSARADVLLQRGDVDHARREHEHVLSLRKRLLGAEHADTLRSKTALACILMVLNEHEAARNLFDKVLQAQLRRLGPDHPDTRHTVELIERTQPCADARLARPATHSAAQDDRLDASAGVRAGAQPGEAPVRELHQDASMDDYGDELGRPPHLHAAMAAASLRALSGDDFLALDEQLGGGRPPSR